MLPPTCDASSLRYPYAMAAVTIATPEPQPMLLARLVGHHVEWFCPRCQQFNRHPLKRGQWRIRCVAKECNTIYAYGVRICRIDARGSKAMQPPVDTLFPAVPVERWPGASAPINALSAPELPAPAEAEPWRTSPPCTVAHAPAAPSPAIHCNSESHPAPIV